MRVAAPRLRSLLCLVVVATSWAAPPGAHGQPVTTVARAGWRVGGTVNAVARLGNVLYIGGNFRGVAPEGNVAAGILAVDATTGLPGPAAKINGNVMAIESDGAGGWYLGGNFLDAVSGGTLQSRIRLAHLLPSGDVDPAFTATADGGAVRALEFVPGVGLFVGGDFTGLNGSARSRVGLLNASTGALLPWTYTVANATNNASVRALAHDAGALVIGGTFGSVNGTARTNLAVVSATDINQLGPGFPADGLVEGLMVAPTGTVYIGGGFSNVSSAPRARLAKATLTAATRTLTLDPAWNPGADANVRAFSAGAGTVFVGGDFRTAGGAARLSVAEIDVATGAPTAFAPEFSGSVNALALSNGQLFATGAFDAVSEEGRYGAAAITVATGALLPWNPGPVGPTSAMAVTGNTVVLGGSIVGFGAVSRTNAAAVDLQSGAILAWNPNPGAQIDEILVHGNSLYISGNFSFIAGDQRRGVAKVDPIFGEALDFDAQLNGNVTAMVIDGNGLYLGGPFTTPRMRLARFDLTTGALDPAFAATVTGTVNDLAVAGGTLFLGGNTITVNGGGPSPLAAVTAATGAPVPGFTFSADNAINELDVEGGFLYLGGSFSSVNFTPRDAVARVSTTTGALDGWAPDVEMTAGLPFGFTRSLNDVDAVNGVVILSGAFETVGGQTRFGVATVDSTSGAPTAWAPQLGSPPLGGFGGAILTAPDLTVIGGGRIQLADELLNGLALFVEPSSSYVLPPTNLSATVIGSTITFTWALPPLGLAGVSFVLEAGTASGLTNIGSLPIGTATSFTVNGVPPGTYYVRVRSVHASGTSLPTPDIAVTVGGVGCTSPPQPPIDFDYQYDDNGGLLQLSWTPPAGPAPTGYLLQAGTSPGLANIASVLLGPVPEIVVPGVPPAVFYIRILSVNGCGVSAPSPNFPLVLDETLAPPLPPLGFTGTASGGVIQLSWIEPPFLTPSSYQLEAGSAPGLSNLGVLRLTSTSFSVGGVPPGVYYLRVRGANAAGVGEPSAELRLVVP